MSEEEKSELAEALDGVRDTLAVIESRLIVQRFKRSTPILQHWWDQYSPTLEARIKDLNEAIEHSLTEKLED